MDEQTKSNPVNDSKNESNESIEKKKRERDDFVETALETIQEIFSKDEIINGIFPMKNNKTKSTKKIKFDTQKTKTLFGNYFNFFP